MASYAYQVHSPYMAADVKKVNPLLIAPSNVTFMPTLGNVPIQDKSHPQQVYNGLQPQIQVQPPMQQVHAVSSLYGAAQTATPLPHYQEVQMQGQQQFSQPRSTLHPQTQPTAAQPEPQYVTMAQLPAQLGAASLPVASTASVDPSTRCGQITASFANYVVVRLNGSGASSPLLTERGVSSSIVSSVASSVKERKSKNNWIKGFLWTGTFILFGVIGVLLCHFHCLGNKPLRKHLDDKLEEVNNRLVNQKINVRFAWVAGELRAYYK